MIELPRALLGPNGTICGILGLGDLALLTDVKAMSTVGMTGGHLRYISTMNKRAGHDVARTSNYAPETVSH